MSFTVAGSTHISLVNPSSAEVAAVSRQLGLAPTDPVAHPDVIVEYHSALEPVGPLRQVELGRFGWADDQFWLLRGLGGRRARVTLDPAALDLPLRMKCERRGTGVPLLTQMLSAVVATRGGVAVHAAAFHLEGKNVLVAGWSESGKSEALVAAGARGADPIGDDTVYLDGHTGLLRGLPVPVRLKAWYTADLPELRNRLDRLSRLRLAPGEVSAALARRGAAGPGSTAAGRLGRKLAQVADRALTASAPLESVAGPPLDQDGHQLDHVVLVVNSDNDAVQVRAADPTAVALRVQASLQEERDNLVAAYRQMRFAFPGAAWPMLDGVDEAETAVLTRAFSRAQVWQLEHPHPVGIARLGGALAQIVTGGP